MGIKELRAITGLSAKKFGEKYGGIPLRTIQSWEAGDRQPPKYVIELLKRAVEADLKK